MSNLNLPQQISEELIHAKNILLNAGASEVFLFGSYADGTYNENSDIDLAISGLDKSKFFDVYGQLLTDIKINIDLVGLDYESNFSKLLLQSGNLRKI